MNAVVVASNLCCIRRISVFACRWRRVTRIWCSFALYPLAKARDLGVFGYYASGRHHDSKAPTATMSEAYERERLVFPRQVSIQSLTPLCRQNNSRLDELASKVSALRGVTVDIYDNARSQDLIDNSVHYRCPSPLRVRWG